jgi:adenylylsulfate kinase
VKFFTGIDDPYEAPLSPEIELHPDRMSPPECALFIVEALQRRGILAEDLLTR